MLENGMVLNHEKYDPQEQPDGRTHKCCMCGDYFYGCEVKRYNNRDEVCPNCTHEYHLKVGSDYFIDYIKDNLHDAALTWWQQCKTQEERDKFIEFLFEFLLQNRTPQMNEFIIDFCRESEDFDEWVSKKL